jgi:hypothetical protein
MRGRDGRGLRGARNGDRIRHDKRPSIAVLGQRTVVVRLTFGLIARRSHGSVHGLRSDIPDVRSGLLMARSVHGFAVLGAGHVTHEREVREAGELRAETQHRKRGRGKPRRAPFRPIL